MFYSSNWPNFIVWLPILLEILGNMRIVINCCPVFDVINFEINQSFLIKPFFYMTKKSGQKCNISRTKELLTCNKKHFSSIFSLKSIKIYFLEGESPTLKCRISKILKAGKNLAWKIKRFTKDLHRLCKQNYLAMFCQLLLLPTKSFSLLFTM